MQAGGTLRLWERGSAVKNKCHIADIRIQLQGIGAGMVRHGLMNPNEKEARRT